MRHVFFPSLPFPVVLVGGAVRDVLLGCEPKDLDFATPLRPEEVLARAAAAGVGVFPKGTAFGVVSLVVDGRECEVASYRAEWYGGDAHRPEGVRFGASLVDDLSRRDFTINAMAMAPDGEIVDPFGGRKDLARGLIRAVGNPAERFAEDALRLFRACRFAACYGFTIEERTLAAMPGAVHRVAGISVERVRDELEKTLLAPRPSVGLRYLLETGLVAAVCRAREDGREKPVPVLPELRHLAGLSQNPRYHRLDAWEHTLAVVDGVPPEPVLRWAALLHDAAKGLPGVRCLNRCGEVADHGHERVGAEMAGAVLTRLRVRPDVARRAVWLVRRHMDFPVEPSERLVRRWLARLARDFRDRREFGDAVRQLVHLRRADARAGKADPGPVEDVARVAARVLETVPFFRADLAVDGRDVLSSGLAGPEVGKALDVLLERVRNGELANRDDVLREALQKYAQRRAGCRSLRV